jgi:hypothetical protein
MPGDLPRWAIRRPFGIRPRAEIPRPFGIRRLQVPGAAEPAAVVAAGTVAGILVVVVGTAAVVDTAAVECIPAAAVVDTLAAAWPTAAPTDNRANISAD